MKYVFVDTSIFVANNFLHGNQIKQLLTLCEEGYINILLPKITYKEIISNAKKNVEEAIQKFSSFRSAGKALRNFVNLESKFDEIQKEETISAIEQMINDSLSKANVTIIEYSALDIGYVFDKYFSEEYPFSKSKKNEFPDAFSLYMLEKWCHDNAVQCHVFAKDGDITNYVSDYLLITDDIKEFIDTVLRERAIDKHEAEKLEKIDASFKAGRDELIGKIESWVDAELDNTEAYNGSIELEVFDVSIEEINVYLDDYKIVSITDGDIILESDVEIQCKVNLEIADEGTAYYDDEEREWIYDGTVEIDFTKDITIPVQFIMYVPNSGKFSHMDIEVYSINNNKSLHF